MGNSAKRSLSVRIKVVIAVMVFALAFTVFIYFISSEILLKSYANIEEAQTTEDVQRVTDALKNALDQLDVKLVDWAWWDDTYAFVHDKNPAYLESNLGPSSLANLKINGMVFADENGNIVFKEMIDFNTQQELSSDSIAQHLKDHPELITHDAKASPITGIISLPEGPAYVASEPILTSQGDGPIHGSLIFIKFLTTDEVNRLGELTHLDVTTYAYSATDLPADVLTAKTALTGTKEKFILPISNDVIAGYTVIKDLYHAPILLMRIETARPVYNQGKETFSIYGFIMGGVAPAFGLLVLFVLQRLMFSRLTRLNKEIEKIGQSREASQRVTEGPRDELGDLEATVNQMLTEVDAAQADLEKFKLAVESADEHVIITDPDGKVLYANPSAEKITGYAASEMLGKTPSLWGGQMPASFYKELWNTISKQKRTFIGEVNNKRKGGERYLASVRISPILNAKGQVSFFVGLEQDITKARQSEQELQQYAAALKTAKDSIELEVQKKTKELTEERARFLASVNSLQIGFTIIDTNGELLIHNPALPAILGTKEELKTLDNISIVLGGGINLSERLKECTEKHCVVDIGEIPFGQKYVRVFITPVFVDGGDSPLGGVLLLEDITEAKAVERAKTEFVSLASHQLRTPLSTINWYIEMLLGGDAGRMTKNQKSYLEEIATGNRRMVALVNSLLNVSRLDLGNLTIQVAPTKIANLIKDSVAIMEPKIKEQKLTVNTILEDIPDVPLDEKYFRMIIDNVIGNAVRYTPEGGVVDVRLVKLDAGKTFGKQEMTESTIGLSVSDTGYGIPEAQQKKVFEKLFRADNVLDKDEEGTGLGLYTVKQIIDQSGGKIWFESKENVGTTFYIAFPATGMKPQAGTKTLT